MRRIFWRHRWLLVALLLLPVTAVAAVRLTEPVRYAATATIQAQSAAPQADTEAAALLSRVTAVAASPAVVQAAMQAVNADGNAQSVARHEVTVSSLGSSAIMTVTVTSPSPLFAVQDAVPGHPHVPLLEGRDPVVMVQLGVPLSADAEQAEVDQPDHAGEDPVPFQAPAPQVLHGPVPQCGQRAGEPEHVRELLIVPLRTPHRVLEVLQAAFAVRARGLDVAQRIRGDPDVLPGRRDPERADPLQRLLAGQLRARRVQVPEAAGFPDPRKARAVRVTAREPGYRGRQRRPVDAHDL